MSVVPKAVKPRAIALMDGSRPIWLWVSLFLVATSIGTEIIRFFLPPGTSIWIRLLVSSATIAFGGGIMFIVIRVHLLKVMKNATELEQHRRHVCPECFYPLHQLSSVGNCPECGRPYSFAELEKIWQQADDDLTGESRNPYAKMTDRRID